MKIRKNKITAITIVIFFILSMASHATPLAKAGNISLPTIAYLNLAPNPAGVGQTVTVGMWLAQPPPTANVQYGDRWQNFKVAVTKPDGTTETLGPFTSDDTGGTYTTYTPSQVGNYSFFFTFPGQILAGSNLSPAATAFTKAFIGDYFEPSNISATLTVQQEPIPSLPNNPLPTSYWQTPVNSENVYPWSILTGNWLGLGQIFSANTGNYNCTSNYNPYTTSPTTAHIMWTRPAAPGGVLGGEFGATGTSNYYATSQYEPKFAPIKMNGIMYYTQYQGTIANPTGWVAVDLYTGKTLWTTDYPLTLPSPIGSTSTLQPNVASAGPCTVLRCGQTLYYVSPNQFGALTYLWSTGTPAIVAAATNIAPTVMVDQFTHAATASTTYNMFDASTGNYILSIVNGTAMTLTEDDQGNLIGYYINSTTETLNEWNSTLCVQNYDLATNFNTNIWEWRPPQGAIIPFSYGLEWTMPIATNITGVPLPQSLSFGATGSDIGGSVNSGVVLLTCITPGENFFTTGFQIEAAYSSSTGQQLWAINRTEAPGTRVDITSPSSGIYVEINQDNYQAIGYSAATGSQLWTLQLTNCNPYDSTGGFRNVLANGIMYLYGFGGDIWAINMANGTIIWQTNTNTIQGDAGTNTPYGTWPLWTFDCGTVADGVLYIPEGHEYSPPLFHGAQQLAINITTGQLVWKILGFDVTNPPAIAFGIATVMNAYDNQIYAYGKGPSATTVSTPQNAVTTSTPVTITGTAMDISAGSKQEAIAANFPNGLPCVSDASMTQFMEAVYEQQVMPSNITGVPVTIAVTDSNGNCYPIGTATTTPSGFYSLTWTPTISGNFTVTATFAGTQSYYGSSATSAFYASLPQARQAPTAAPIGNVATQSTLEYIGIAIIIVIVIIGAVLAILVTRKHP